MTGADPDRPVTDNRPSTLRIGGWLPPATPADPHRDGGSPPPAPLTALNPPGPPVGTAPGPQAPRPAAVAWGDTGCRPVRVPWIPPAVPSSLGEQPAHRRGRTIGHPGGPRAFLLMAIAAAASVPLVLGMAKSPDSSGYAAPRTTSPMRLTQPSVRPQPAVATPAPAPTSTPTSRGAADSSPTPSPSATSPGGPAGGGGGGGSTALPTPPSPVPVNLSLEAEGPSATMVGPATIRELAGASGGAVVTGLGHSTGLVRFEFEAPAAGSYALTFHYLATERLRARITVNGSPFTLQCLPTGADTIGEVRIEAQLHAGRNTVEFGNKNAPAPDLDRLQVTS